MGDIASCPSHELYEIRKLFGVLFQDGAMFGSMSLYDNVAFPLREHTRKVESEIRKIVMEKMELVFSVPRTSFLGRSRVVRASAPVWRALWSWTPRSCSSTNRIPAWTRSAPRSSTSSSST